MSDPTTQEQNPEAPTRERILRAATAEIAERGFAGMRIDTVAAAANCNKQLIYYYFRNKVGVREAVLERMAALTVPYWNRMDGLDMTAAANATMDRYDDSEETRLWRRLLAWEGIEPGERDHIVLEERRTEAWTHLTAVFEAAHARGELHPDVDPKVAALLLPLVSVSLSTLPQIVKMITGYEADDPELRGKVRQVLTHLTDLLKADGRADGRSDS
jgi:TetR/AcrR family transcriptional regulator